MLTMPFTSENYVNLIKMRDGVPVHKIFEQYGATFFERKMVNEYPYNEVLEESYLEFKNEADMIMFVMKYY